MQQPNQLSPWQAWSLDVQHKLREQQERIDKLETQVNALYDQVKKLEARPSYNIESIEYHFDQLKVEQLDGTLNIGMTAPGSGNDTFPGSIDQLSVTEPQVFPSAGPAITPLPAPYDDIFAEMNRYLDTQAAQKLISYENELCLPLDPFHRRIIIEDIRKQVPTRIQYYMQQFSNGAEGQSDAKDTGNITSSVLAKTTRDTDAALFAYMRQLQNGSPSSGGMA
ncbi:spore germination protein GerPC [Paenibacillus alkaliterrae]|uniref:spore germination protein GerPC n=1 Tax=Paenibacillus alkaliterrae TaxID=320909 RepID=UPI001F36C4A9|nr:spore germination protein GerPC [Paenibacillus alkaliterrae]MCF2937476.1 spore germination protein GerPC [Paenibacillus alkaliterrae]